MRTRVKHCDCFTRILVYDGWRGVVENSKHAIEKLELNIDGRTWKSLKISLFAIQENLLKNLEKSFRLHGAVHERRFNFLSNNFEEIL